MTRPAGFLTNHPLTGTPVIAPPCHESVLAGVAEEQSAAIWDATEGHISAAERDDRILRAWQINMAVLHVLPALEQEPLP